MVTHFKAIPKPPKIKEWEIKRMETSMISSMIMWQKIRKELSYILLSDICKIFSKKIILRDIYGCKDWPHPKFCS